jgi:hypothetical protein
MSEKPDAYASEDATEKLLRQSKLPEPLRLAEHLEQTMQWPLHGKAADCLRSLYEELEATNRQVEILSDALSESRREIAAIMQAITDPENQPSQFGTVTMAHMQREVAAEREACAKACDEVDKESQSQWPKRLATMIRARGQA